MYYTTLCGDLFYLSFMSAYRYLCTICFAENFDHHCPWVSVDICRSPIFSLFLSLSFFLFPSSPLLSSWKLSECFDHHCPVVSCCGFWMCSCKSRPKILWVTENDLLNIRCTIWATHLILSNHWSCILTANVHFFDYWIGRIFALISLSVDSQPTPLLYECPP